MGGLGCGGLGYGRLWEVTGGYGSLDYVLVPVCPILSCLGHSSVTDLLLKTVDGLSFQFLNNCVSSVKINQNTMNCLTFQIKNRKLQDYFDKIQNIP